MKLFLSALGVSDDLRRAFLDLVGKDDTDIRLVHIENAADPLPDDRRGFLSPRRTELAGLCGDYQRLDLRDFIGRTAALLACLSECDVVWIGGGNVFYLRHLLHATGFDEIIRPLLEQGVIYGGGSAGAIVVGPTLEGYEAVDNLSLSPEVMWNGMGLVDFAPIPHWGHPAIDAALIGIRSDFDKSGVNTVPIRDGQAIIVVGLDWNIAP